LLFATIQGTLFLDLGTPAFPHPAERTIESPVTVELVDCGYSTPPEVSDCDTGAILGTRSTTSTFTFVVEIPIPEEDPDVDYHNYMIRAIPANDRPYYWRSFSSADEDMDFSGDPVGIALVPSVRDGETRQLRGALDYPWSSIRGIIFDDQNGDGRLANPEEVAGGVSIQLLDAGGGVVATTTSTNELSSFFENFRFNFLDAGNYRVQAQLPDGNSAFNVPAGSDFSFGYYGLSEGIVLGWGEGPRGVIGFHERGPLVVNSTRDVADSSTADNRCDTGSDILRDGQPEDECTLRAAIQQANSQIGTDMILFRIPGAGIPTIRPTSALPEISDPVEIDGSSLTGAPAVELDGSAAGANVPGLTISAGSSVVRGMVINRFTASGVELITNGNNAIYNNLIGTDVTGLVAQGNQVGGVFIFDSSNNTIGGVAGSEANRIGSNHFGGVIVRGSSSQGNSIRGNVMVNNGFLGIDLAYDTVSPNDTGDADVGPNGLMNFPIITSATVIGENTIIIGTLDTANPELATVDIYSVPVPDSSGHGEGRLLLGSTTPSSLGAFTLVVPDALVEPFVSATATESNNSTSEFSSNAPVCRDTNSNGNGDDDGDGLCDNWETSGFDANGDGTIDLALHLAPFNADPLRRDLFLEIDYMQNDTHSHEPIDEGLADVIAAFAAAPVANPDGTTGVTFHPMVDEAVPEIEPILFSSRGPGAADDFLDLKLGASSCGTGATDGHFGTVGNRTSPNCSNILSARQQVFRYAIYGHNYSEHPGSSGVAELGGNDLMVTLGGWSDAGLLAGSGLGPEAFIGEAKQLSEAGTLMHEFGHSLGLEHGGLDGVNCKPNYLSIMSYSLQFRAADPTRPLDYSRQALADRNETVLNEAAGIGGPAGRTAIFGVGGATRVAPADGSIDWNGDGDTDDLMVAEDVTFSRNCRDPSPGQMLRGHNDWPAIQYAFRNSLQFADGVVLSQPENQEPEPTAVQIVEVAQSVDFDRDGLSNAADNCPAVSNADQNDLDSDGYGDTCDLDLDGDGVLNTIEIAAPNGGDGNQDSTSDHLQPKVSSLPNVLTGEYVTLVSAIGTTLADVAALANPLPGGTLANATFPFGYFDFTVSGLVPGATTTVDLRLPDSVSANTYYLYGPTPASPTPHWFEFMFDGTTGAVFNFNGNLVTLHFVDGQRGDLDLLANGVIRDPGGPTQLNNAAPVLDNSGAPYLIAPAGTRLPVEMTNGILVTDLLARGAGGNPVTDSDGGALEGIALTAIDKTLGTWQYAVLANPSDTDWLEADVAGAISNTSALLLAADANTRLRFVTALLPRHNSQKTDGSPATPAEGFLPLETKLDTGLTFRAWDRTTGTVGGRADTTSNGGTTAFSIATETVGTYFETRLFRSFNAAAQLNTYTLEQEFNALVSGFGYQDRSTADFSGFTILMSPIPGVTTAALYRMYFGIAFDSPSLGIQTDMGYRYLTTDLAEVGILESIGPEAHRAERDGFYYRELGVNGGTGITGYVYTTAQSGTTEMVQIYRTDLFSKDTRTGPSGSPATGTVQQEQGDHAYTTKPTFEMTKTPGRPHVLGVQTGWRLESSRGFVRELSPNAGGAGASARRAPVQFAAEETSLPIVTSISGLPSGRRDDSWDRLATLFVGMDSHITHIARPMDVIEPVLSGVTTHRSSRSRRASSVVPTSNVEAAQLPTQLIPDHASITDALFGCWQELMTRIP
jgi:hypothetical protein